MCQEIIESNNKAFRRRVRKLSFEEIAQLDRAQVQQFYATAQLAYAEKGVQISRYERAVLYHAQERLFGGLEPKLKQSLERIGEAMVKRPDKRKKKLNYTLPPVGAVLVKYWRGERLEVKRVASGFEYRNQHYATLSKLARDIAGYSVSGPIFFGLRQPKSEVA